MSRITNKYSDGTPFIPNEKLQTIGMEGVAKELAKYEDAKENGMLVIFPCDIGTLVYIPAFGKVEIGKVRGIECRNREKGLSSLAYEVYTNDDCFLSLLLTDFNKTWFLTEKEARLSLGKK